MDLSILVTALSPACGETRFGLAASEPEKSPARLPLRLPAVVEEDSFGQTLASPLLEW